MVSKLNVPGPSLYLALAAPQAELLAQADRIRNESLLVAIIAMSLATALAIICSRLASRPLQALTREAAAIQELKFDTPMEVRSHITEIDVLARTMESMKSTIRRFLSIGAALAGERNFDRLLECLLSETTYLASARGGMVYLTEPDGSLRCALARWDDVLAPTFPPDLQVERDDRHPVIRSLQQGSLAQIVHAAELSTWYGPFAEGDAMTLFAVPLRNRQAEIVGALALLQKVGALGDAQECEVLTLVEALSGTAAAAIDSQRLILEQKRLLESFIQLVADAIDRKSPYTGGHCQRVPELTKMIARAAEAATEGPFKDFALSEAQWEELHIAAWLHDCGKVTSPEYIVDKATKLETIYDRLHEVRMRFEVVKREAEVTCWREIAHGAPREQRLAELMTLWTVLDEEYSFVATCNEGGEFMAADKIERLHQIAQRTWTRTLDDRIGLSEDEKRRKARGQTPPPPAVEQLLADKPEHVVERRPEDRIAPDNEWGFKLDVPANLYNRGEIYNLTIGRGTLTAEDRYKINEHIVETIRMLSRLPLPRHLSHVVEIASGHHEKMDGTGYPRRLSREEMSWPARMMAIADIFEALTAADRPYKKAKTLSESLSIMAHMRDDSHIDPEIFDLVLSAEVYRTYAAAFLAPEQIDDVDPERYRLHA
ncbi:MAG TPA: HD domain-containing phosphohydrolase [Stellaceae bacterium]|nr:HD domain-containing phosphohydrolase [Stellaceae bacterium]